MNSPQISIIIPVYNVEKYLGICIDSILGQKLSNLEIILVNDGSTDSSGKICEDYASKYDCIKIINKENGGLSDARNAGLRLASGEFILFVDSDDYIAENSLLQINKIVDQNPNLDVVFLEATKIYEDNLTIPMNDGYSKEFIHDKNHNEVLSHIAQLPKFPGSACTKLIKRRLIVDNNLYFEKGLLSEDIDWVVKLLLSAKKFDYFEKQYYCYRQNRKGSITNTVSIKNVKSLLYIIKKWSKPKIDRSSTDYLKQEYLNAFMAYEYLILLANYANLPRDEKRKVKEEVYEFSWLLSYGINRKTKVVNIFKNILGINITSLLLKYYIKNR